MTNSPLALIFGNEDFLSKGLSQTLSSKGVNSKIIKNISELRGVTEIPNYVFFIQGFSGHFSDSQIKQFFDFIEKYSPKTQIILPYVVDEKSRKSIEKLSSLSRKVKNRNLQIVYLGQVYGIGMNFLKDEFIAQVFNSLREKKNILVSPFDFDLYLIEASQAFEMLIKSLFSYGFSEREVVLSYKMSAFDFLKKVQVLFPNVLFSTDKNFKQSEILSNFNFAEGVSFSPSFLKETIDWVISQTVQIKKKRIKKININKKKPFVLLLISFWILSFPFVLILVSSIFLRIGFSSIANLNSSAGIYFDLSATSISFPSSIFSNFNEIGQITLMIGEYAKVGKTILSISSSYEKIMKGVNEGNYDLTSLSEKLSYDLLDLYRHTSFVMPDFDKFLNSHFFLPETNLSSFSNYAFHLSNLSKDLPDLLGQSSEVNYAVILQDTSELRPTGGLLTSVGIFSFDKGKLVSKNFFNISDLSKLIRGQIDPPFALQKYLGKNNWDFVDANWDPDFSVSASKIEWFLEKATGQKVDGVIGVNLNSFDSISNFNGTSEEWGKEVFSDFRNRGVQIFLNNEVDEREIEQLYLSSKPDDFAAVVEANLGNNKVNPDINRKQHIDVSFDGKYLQHTLTIDYTNSSNSISYRNYLRLIAPSSSIFSSVTENMNGISSNLTFDSELVNDQNRAGVLVQVPVKGSLSIVFKWKSPFSMQGKRGVNFYMRKQPGIDSVPTDINFNLTNDARSSYNTDLSSDFSVTVPF